MFAFCSYAAMQLTSPESIARVVLAAPAWMRLGIAVRDSRMRERAAVELACVLIEGLDVLATSRDPDQLALPF